MAHNEIYSVNTRQLSGMLQQCLEANVVPMIHGSPGIGKSAITGNVSNNNNLMLIDHRLSTAAPEDQTGLPFKCEDGFARFAPFADLFPLQSTPLPEGKDGWLLFLDELNSASKAVMASAYKLILDRMTGQHKLHDRCMIVGAGNLNTDRAIVNNIGTALQSRMVHLELRVDHRVWMEDVAYTQNYDERIIGFLNQFPERLMDFRPDHTDRTFCCPRTWEFMNRLVTSPEGKPREVLDSSAALYAGTITSGTAVEFISYCRNAAKLITIDRVLADPKGCPVPHEAAIKWATVTHLLSKHTMDNLGKVLEYVERFDASFKIMFVRALVIRNNTVTGHPAFALFLSKMTNLLND
ncbi:MoxR-like ATPase [Xanthomonas virus PB119]|nr:MoxR-like ATPase [Xanthomonas virus PB119]